MHSLTLVSCLDFGIPSDTLAMKIMMSSCADEKLRSNMVVWPCTQQFTFILVNVHHDRCMVYLKVFCGALSPPNLQGKVAVSVISCVCDDGLEKVTPLKHGNCWYLC